MDRAEVASTVELAQSLVRERFPDARAAWLGGSVVRGDATATSDLDITVLLAGPPAPFRESLEHAGWPVELFVHTEASLWHYCRKDQERRRPTIMRLVGESIILADTDGIAVDLQQACAAAVTAGPAPLSEGDLGSARYALTDLITDLEGVTDPAQQVAISAVLWQEAAALLLAGSGRWAGSGKALVRELRELDRVEGTSITDDLVAGLRESIAGSSARLIDGCDGILARFGGRRFSGHRVSGESPGVDRPATPSASGSVNAPA
jgi:hypothetical protein